MTNLNIIKRPALLQVDESKQDFKIKEEIISPANQNI
jgi:hypothetical protein